MDQGDERDRSISPDLCGQDFMHSNGAALKATVRRPIYWTPHRSMRSDHFARPLWAGHALNVVRKISLARRIVGAEAPSTISYDFRWYRCITVRVCSGPGCTKRSKRPIGI